jgi:hypothetical protein
VSAKPFFAFRDGKWCSEEKNECAAFVSHDMHVRQSSSLAVYMGRECEITDLTFDSWIYVDYGFGAVLRTPSNASNLILLLAQSEITSWSLVIVSFLSPYRCPARILSQVIESIAAIALTFIS